MAARRKDIVTLFGNTPITPGHLNSSLIEEVVGAVCPVDGRPCACQNAARIALWAFFSAPTSAWLGSMSTGRQNILADVYQVVVNEYGIEVVTAMHPEMADDIRQQYDAMMQGRDGTFIAEHAQHITDMKDFEETTNGRFVYCQCPHGDIN